MVTNQQPRHRLALPTRIAVGLLAIVLVLLLATARSLEPDPRGYGTHEQLGFEPCSFYRFFGRQCPTCGTTTAWAWALRGNLTAALRANMPGTLLCGLTLAFAPWLAGSAVAGRWLIVVPSLFGVFAAGGLWMAVALEEWLRRVWL